MVDIFSGITQAEILTGIGITLGFIGYYPYLRDMIVGTTKPHIFSRFIWGILTCIAFFGQLHDGGGIASWVLGVSVITCFFTAGYAITHGGKKYITQLDWWLFIGALGGIGIWRITKDPLWSIYLVTIIDALGFYPTVRKGRYKPFTETPIMYTLSGIKYIFAIWALGNISIVTTLYPASLIIMNCGFAVLLRRRRKQLLTP